MRRKSNHPPAAIVRAEVYSTGHFVYLLGRSWSRKELAEHGIASFRAAQRLSRLLNRKGIKTVRDLEKLDQFTLRAYPNVGDRTVYVAMCLVRNPLKWISKLQGEE